MQFPAVLGGLLAPPVLVSRTSITFSISPPTHPHYFYKQIELRDPKVHVSKSGEVRIFLEFRVISQIWEVQWRRQDLRTGRVYSRARSNMVGPQNIWVTVTIINYITII